MAVGDIWQGDGESIRPKGRQTWEIDKEIWHLNKEVKQHLTVVQRLEVDVMSLHPSE